MNYDEATSAFFNAPLDDAEPEPTHRNSVARRLRDAIEPIAMHPVWSRQTNEALTSLGLDFFSGYVWGRATALGEPSPGVVVSSFAVFEPSLVAGVYEAGRAACGRDQLVSTREQATTASLAAVLEGHEVSAAAARLSSAVTDLDQSGRPLYAGLVDRPMPEDPVGMLWRSAEMIREHRGDSHIAACVAEGLDPVAMNILTELWVGMDLGSYSASRGWDEAALSAASERLRDAGLMNGDGLSEDGRGFREQIEDATDRAQAEIVERLGDDVEGLLTDLNRWSAMCVTARAFPPDPYKRAAG